MVKTERGILLALRKEHGWEGYWHLPGGTVFYREPIEKAVQRLGKEELGVELAIDNFAGYLEYFSEEKSRGFGYSVALVFVCHPKSSLTDSEELQFFKVLPARLIKEQKGLLERIKT